MTTVSEFDAMQDALEICSDLGLEMAPGFATHWPMAVETMIRLGYPANVHDWAVVYRDKRQHLAMPANVGAISGEDESSWKAALGQRTRSSDWSAFFNNALEEAHWKVVLERWWPRLMAGMSAGLTHGLIRTAHAVRSFSFGQGEATKLQLSELAAGLAYWAALHTVQPGSHKLSGASRFPSIIGSIPRLEGRAGVIERGQYQREIPGWPEAVASLSPPENIEAALSDMTASFVQVNLAQNKGFPVPLIHTVTAPAALRMMLPHLPVSYHGPSFVAVWEASAAVLSNFAVAKPDEVTPTTEGEKPSWDELAARAVENGDEHAIKFTEACRREDGVRSDPRYRIAAAQMIPRLAPYFRGKA